MNVDNAFFESLCQISNLAIISKVNSGTPREKAMLEVAELIAIYLSAIVMASENKYENLQDVNPDLILNFIKEQYKV